MKINHPFPDGKIPWQYCGHSDVTQEWIDSVVSIFKTKLSLNTKKEARKNGREQSSLKDLKIITPQVLKEIGEIINGWKYV